MRRRNGFTIVELLVVITVIVVLLALLAPAMDKAIYQAELAVCAAQQRSVGAGLHQYAFDHGKWYPRHIVNPTGAGPGMMQIAGGNRDMRDGLGGYVPLKMLADPFTTELDYSDHPDPADNPEGVWVPYALWFGWTYGRESRGMQKMGDRVTLHKNNPLLTPGQLERDISVNILISDLDLVDQNGGGLVHSAHPDKADALLQLVAFQDAESRGRGVEDDAAMAVGNPMTYSWWEVFGAFQRGPMDLNFLYGDGAVARYNDVLWGRGTSPEQRMVGLPWIPNRPEGGGYPLRRVHLPRN